MPAKGTSCLYRLPPKDFDETFIRVGWTSIEVVVNANWKTVKKWLILRNIERVDNGGLTLEQARRAFVAKHGPAKNPARADYVLRTVRKRQRLMAVAVSDLLEA